MGQRGRCLIQNPALGTGTAHVGVPIITRDMPMDADADPSNLQGAKAPYARDIATDAITPKPHPIAPAYAP